MKHVMIDLETLGTTPNSVILSIGAVGFDFDDDTFFGTKFFQRVDIGSALLAGLDIDLETVKWWRSQSREAKDASFSIEDRETLDYTLRIFSDWFKFIEGKYVWGFGSDFDIALLRRAYDLVKIPTPWHYRDVRCARTIGGMFGDKDKDYVKPTVSHDPIADSISQIRTLRNTATRLGWKIA